MDINEVTVEQVERAITDSCQSVADMGLEQCSVLLETLAKSDLLCHFTERTAFMCELQRALGWGEGYDTAISAGMRIGYHLAYIVMADAGLARIAETATGEED